MNKIVIIIAVLVFGITWYQSPPSIYRGVILDTYQNDTNDTNIDTSYILIYKHLEYLKKYLDTNDTYIDTIGITKQMILK